MIKFKFSKEDCYGIPGLYRGDHERPPLAPVFFKRGCLNKYFTEPEYRCSLNETYGIIDHNKFDIPFGINKNKKVIMWLGDIEKLPEKEEQSYLYSFNIDSDHDIASDFYEAQINKKFIDRIKEVEILLQKSKINKIFCKKFGFNLFKEVFQDDDNGIDEVLKQAEKYSKIIMNQEADFKVYITEWKDILIGDIQKTELIKYLQSQKIKTKKDKNDLGEIKLLEKLVQEKITKDNIIFPYFVLSDLRNWSSHDNGFKIKFNDSLERLLLSKSDANNYELIYKTLIEKIIEFHNKILLWGNLKEEGIRNNINL